MTWTCERCGARFPDSDGERGEGCVSCTQIVAEADLRELYSTLADATEAAAAGDPNRCASLSSDAKERVLEIHTETDQEVER